MGSNDFFASGMSKQQPRTPGNPNRSWARPGTGSSSTVLSLSSEISDIAHKRESDLSKIASNIAIFGVQTATGNIDSHSTEKVRSNLDSLIKAANLTDAEAKEVLSMAIVMIVMNS